jgi:hypothetical protein
MGGARHSHATGRIVGRLILLSFSLILINLLHLLNISSPHQPPTTIAITTRAQKEKTISQTTVTPVDRRPPQCARRLAQSPSSSNANTHLADINKPMLRIENVLQALKPIRHAALNDPNKSPARTGDLITPTNKGSLTTPHKSPTGVEGNSFVSPIGMEQAQPDEVIDTPNETKTEEPPLQPRVHISETTEAVEADALPMYEAPPRRSILQNATGGVNQGQVCETSELGSSRSKKYAIQGVQ